MVLKRIGLDIYFYQNGGECDFLAKEGMKITKCVQVCFDLTLENKDSEVKGLVSAMKKFKLKEGFIVTKSQKETFEIDGLQVIVLPEKEFRKKFGIDSE